MGTRSKNILRRGISLILSAALVSATCFVFNSSGNVFAEGQNLALNKAGTASSIEGTGFEAGKAFDGNTATRWASLEGTDPQWIYVDLGTSYNIARVKLSWEAAYARSYRIEVSSNKTSWTTVYSTTSGDGATDDITFNSTSGRYVRMYGTQRGTEYGYSIYEFEVYEGSMPQIPPVPTGLTASGAGSSQINVSWSSAGGATGYDLEADGTIKSNVTSPYAHTGLAANSAHSYRVRAKNSAGTSAWSTSASASTLPQAGGVGRPFPQNLSYAGCIKPNQQTQQQLNAEVTSYYTYWKSQHLKTSSVTNGGYYVYSPDVTGDDVNDPITCSEAHGYGMMITALMAGYDSNAKVYFDGLYKMYNAHRSPINNNLMAWAIGRSERAADCGQSAATDGDMDIAYALLLAHYQWGSNGSINYLSEANRIINSGLKGSEVSTSTKRTLLGDWSSDQLATRSSDWMADHFRVYYAATGDSFWNNVADTAYGIISRMHTNYSQNTGLVPDFVINNPAQPAPANYLEFPEDGDYGYNACRYPWRIATDYALFGTPAAKTAMNKLLNWLKVKTSNNPGNITACYRLGDGEELKPGETSMAFTAPFTAACIVDSAHQDYLNQGWNLIKSTREGYYGDSITLLCMILISGNWWAPQ